MSIDIGSGTAQLRVCMVGIVFVFRYVCFCEVLEECSAICGLRGSNGSRGPPGVVCLCVATQNPVRAYYMSVL